MKTLYVTCPSYAMRGPAERAKHLASARSLARRIDARVIVSPLMARYPGSGSWLSEDDRAADLAEAVRHDIVWACRGGYGSMHLVDALLGARTRKRPLLVGHSDITILHACWRKRGWGEGLYGPTTAPLRDSRAAESLLPLLRGRALARSNETDAVVRVLVPGEVRGPCFPACLTVLAGLCGTPAQPDLHGAVLAIEDIEESPYRVDFALSQLSASGTLEGLGALVGGSFLHQVAADYEGPTVDEVLAEWGRRLNVPVVSRLPFGHLDDALFLPGGRPVALRADAGGAWLLQFAARTGKRARTG